MIWRRSSPRRSKSTIISYAFRCLSGLQFSMWCKISIPEGLSALIRRYSSSPSTALYIAAKSMTGTVRVPSMSNTTPRKRCFAVAPETDIRAEREVEI
uniref:Haloacid dehalogenase-like hydrolase domain-containing protein At2g33255 isoform X2 n=1 Tax=Rhizophora mucronata TaxID=61149 RepID=A0A2P2KH22_RHIMU